MSNLKDLMVDSKSVWVDCDPVPGFEVEISYIPRTEMTAIVKSCTNTKWDKSTRKMENVMDDEKFLNKFVGRAINNWRGLTMERLEGLVPINYEDKNKELEYNEENAVFLVKQSAVFDEWLNDTISDIDSFRK